MRQRANFSVKGEIGASPLVIIEDSSKIFGPKKYKEGQDDKEDELLEKHRNKSEYSELTVRNRTSLKIRYYIYKGIRLFYTSIYFYYYPLMIIIVPFVWLLWLINIEC